MEQKVRDYLSMNLKIAGILLLLLLSLSAMFPPISPPEVLADYSHRERMDSWGNAIQIIVNYNEFGGHVDFKAVGAKSGFRISQYGIGYTIGTPLFIVKKMTCTVRAYDEDGNLIAFWKRTYNPRKAGSRPPVYQINNPRNHHVELVQDESWNKVYYPKKNRVMKTCRLPSGTAKVYAYIEAKFLLLNVRMIARGSATETLILSIYG